MAQNTALPQLGMTPQKTYTQVREAKALATRDTAIKKAIGNGIAAGAGGIMGHFLANSSEMMSQSISMTNGIVAAKMASVAPALIHAGAAVLTVGAILFAFRAVKNIIVAANATRPGTNRKNPYRKAAPAPK